ncbi:MAG: hypothetical protein NFCOHLIN_00623 [Gammaproteobacteria bacterium]|nr:hypothetical protein [Gammaproteobacteria bacterium]
MLRPLALVLAVLFIAACTRVGPDTVRHDRFDYNAALADSWQEQILLNIVKLRYLDTPVFLDVASIVSGYTIESTISASGSIFPDLPGEQVNLGAQGKYTDRPTITYAPLTGPEFVKSLMTPLPPPAVLFLLQSGYAADFVLGIAVDSVNGLQNRRGQGADPRPADPQFYAVLELLREIQLSGAVEVNIKPMEDKQEAVFMVFQPRAEIGENGRALRELLGLDPDATEFRVFYGGAARGGRQIAMLTRSMLHIMIELASYVEVPERHVAEQRAVPTAVDPGDDKHRLIRIHSTAEQPADAFVAVPYHGHWFWIDDRDLISKRTFTFLMLLFTLANQGPTQNLPLVTIPAG